MIAGIMVAFDPGDSEGLFGDVEHWRTWPDGARCRLGAIRVHHLLEPLPFPFPVNFDYDPDLDAFVGPKGRILLFPKRPGGGWGREDARSVSMEARPR